MLGAKALVAIAAEEDGAGLGRIRMRRIRRAHYGFIQEAVERTTAIHTDGWEGYVGLDNETFWQARISL